jgi:invasion protein IalB
MQDYSPCAGRQGERPEFRPDRTAGEGRPGVARKGYGPVQRIVVMTSLVLSSLRAIGFAAAAVCLASALAPPAAAATKPGKAAPKPGTKDEASKPALVATFGDWNVFVGEVGKGRICYTLAQPKSREPTNLKRDPGYAFISDRPAEGVRNEVSFIMGFDVAAADIAESKPDAKPGEKPASKSDAKPKTSAVASTPLALVDEATFEMLPKGGNLWVKNAAKESALVAEMRKGAKLVIKAASLRGHQSIDTYSLTGFAQAMERLQKECPGK